MNEIPAKEATLASCQQYHTLLAVGEAISAHRDLKALLHDLAGRLREDSFEEIVGESAGLRLNTKERTFMNSFDRTIRDRDDCVENLAAELTDAAYPVALRHGVAGSSIDLELDLWKALGERLRRHAYLSLSR